MLPAVLIYACKMACAVCELRGDLLGGSEKIKCGISIWTVLYFVVVIMLLIAWNVFSFIRGRQAAQRFREANTIKPHNYFGKVVYTDDFSNLPKKIDTVHKGTVIEVHGITSNGGKTNISGIRKDQIGKEFSKAAIKIASGAGTLVYYIDERTVFEIAKSEEKVDVINTGDEISFEYALYDYDNLLIIGFLNGNESAAEDNCDNEIYTVTSDDILRYALLDLVPLLFFISLYLMVKMIRKKKKKGTIVALICACVFFALISFYFFIDAYLSRAKAAAPVIYLYPDKETAVNVRLSLNGDLTTSYPDYESGSGWSVTALPDGTLIGKNGRKYPFLFWEGEVTIKPDLSQGFCVKGSDTAMFLEKSLKQSGLTDTEADAFIMYWLPQMEKNRYNVISFQTRAYADAVHHEVTPEPDTVITVNMLWYPSNTFVAIEPQDLTAINPSERKGFTVVEWGGERYRKVLPVHIG